MKRKPLIVLAVSIVSLMPFAVGAAPAEESVPRQSVAPGEELSAKTQAKEPGKIAFVLAEVRKRIETNPKNQVTELLVDPDFRGEDDIYLVNVLLTTEELKYTLGAVVTLRPAANGWVATVGFVD